MDAPRTGKVTQRRQTHRYEDVSSRSSTNGFSIIQALLIGLLAVGLSACNSSGSGSSDDAPSDYEPDENGQDDGQSGDDAEPTSGLSVHAIGFPEPRFGAESGTVLIDWHDPDVEGLVDVCIAEQGVRLFEHCEAYPGGKLVTSVSDFPLVLEGMDPGLEHNVVVTVDGNDIIASGWVLPATHPLNATGINWCANADENYLECPEETGTFPGQDGEHSRTTVADEAEGDHHFAKKGAGPGAFDFTKIDAFGNPLPADAESFACIRDNRTGLLWEAKTADPEDRHYKGHTYTWYQSADDGHGGDAGTPDGGVCSESSCDTSSFAAEARSWNLCGSSNWRVPEPAEIQSLIDHSKESTPAFPADWFPGAASEPIWSASPKSGDVALAWTVTKSGIRESAPKNEALPVRLVSGSDELPYFINDGEPGCSAEIAVSSRTSGFQFDETDPIALDTSTGLQWARCALGQEWDPDTENCTGSAQNHNWLTALQGAVAANESEDGLHGYDDWRLPNIQELRSIVENRCSAPAMNPDIFSGAPDGRAWSASPSSKDSSQVWAVNFSTGADHPIPKSGGGHVWLVREPIEHPTAEIEVIAASLDETLIQVGDSVDATGSIYNGGNAPGFGEFQVEATREGDESNTKVIGSQFYQGPLNPGFYHLGALRITAEPYKAGTYEVYIFEQAHGHRRHAGILEVAHLEISVIAASVDPTEISVGEEAEVTGSLYASGDNEIEGTFDITLKVNGEVYDTQSVTLDAGFYHLGGANFDFSSDEPGDYVMTVHGQTADGEIDSGRDAGTITVVE